MQDENQMSNVDNGTLAVIMKAEIDTAIATAHSFPRSLKKFVTEARDMVTLNEKVAAECIYAIPRDGKMIEGPSARFAEVMASAWGNCRAGARVVSEDKEFVVSQGVFHDLERNVQITYEVKRRITNKQGKRFNSDMIAVTGNAACSIALRNAVLKGIPKAFWSAMYDEARQTAVGDAKTLATKRAEALAYLLKMGVKADMVYATLGVAGEEDIGLDELAVLRGLATSIKEGELTVEEAFAAKEQSTASTATQAPAGGAPKSGTDGMKAQMQGRQQPSKAPAAAPSGDEQKPAGGGNTADTGNETEF